MSQKKTRTTYEPLKALKVLHIDYIVSSNIYNYVDHNEIIIRTGSAVGSDIIYRCLRQMGFLKKDIEFLKLLRRPPALIIVNCNGFVSYMDRYIDTERFCYPFDDGFCLLVRAILLSNTELNPVH